MRNMLVAPAIAGLLAASASGAVVTQWNFNSNPGDGNTATGVTTPSIGFGTASTVGGITTAFNNGDSNNQSGDPQIGDDSGWQTTSYPAQGANSGTAGVQFAVSTVGLTDITVNFDTRHSNSSSRFVQFQYSLDGTTFTSAGLLNSGIFEATTGGDTWYNNRTADLTGIAGANNNANFAFRMVAVFDPNNPTQYTGTTTGTAYAASGTLRYDMVTVNAVPAPGAVALLGLAGLVGSRRRRA